jgi:alcohol dehydrogenase
LRPDVKTQRARIENWGLVGDVCHADRLDELEPLIDSMLALELDAPYVGHVFDFANLPDALRMFQSGRTQGKVVIKVMK